MDAEKLCAFCRLTGFETGKSLLYARARADFCILTALFSPPFSGTGTREKTFFVTEKACFWSVTWKTAVTYCAADGKAAARREKTGTAKHGGKRQYNTTLCCLLRLKSKTSPENPYAYHTTSWMARFRGDIAAGRKLNSAECVSAGLNVFGKLPYIIEETLKISSKRRWIEY